MNTVVVATHLFPAEPEGDLDHCNGQPGNAFAGWLKEKLTNMGFTCNELIQEDYGWGFWINSQGKTVWVSVSYAPEDTGNGEWFVSATHEIPLLIFKPWLWTKEKQGLAEEQKVYQGLRDAIASESAIEILREE